MTKEGKQKHNIEHGAANSEKKIINNHTHRKCNDYTCIKKTFNRGE